MDYKVSLQYINSISKYGKCLGIKSMSRLFELLSNPDEKIKCLHIAGTNGKGTVSAYLTNILISAGYKVGTFNSPSVYKYNEHFLIDNVSVSDSDIANYMTRLKDIISSEQSQNDDSFSPNSFEIETAIAFLIFLENDCDICIIETGLGGRFDPTNAMSKKELAIITSIGLDHCECLGNSLGQIASEKSAIIHDKCVTIKQSDEILQEIRMPYHIINGIKKHINVDLKIASEYHILSSTLRGQEFAYNGENYFIKMLGEHQIENATLSICTINVLQSMGWKINQEHILNGLKITNWNARFEIVEDIKSRLGLDVKEMKSSLGIDLEDKNTLVFDGMHNQAGAKVLAESISKYFKDKKVGIVIGMLADKDIDECVSHLVKVSNHFVATKSNTDRAMSVEKLKDIIDIVGARNNIQIHCEPFEDIKKGIVYSLSANDVVVVCGSLSLFSSLYEKSINS